MKLLRRRHAAQRVKPRAHHHHRRPHRLEQDQSVVEVLGRDDAIPRTFEQPAQVREHVRRGIRTEHQCASDVFTGMAATVRRGYRIRLGEVRA